jgi:N4-gp56 family major capsid protein
LAGVNVSSSFQAAVRRRLSKEVLPITVRYLIVQQFKKEEKLNKGEGVTWTATRFNRLPLPQAPLSEGVPPQGEQLSIQQVTGVALQWGDRVVLSDVSVITTAYDLVQQAKRLLGIQIAELMERNTFSVLMGGTQVNYVNQRGARASLVAGDVMDTVTINRTFADLEDEGAPFREGRMTPDVQRTPEHGAQASERGPKGSEHYVAVCSPFVEQDLRQNPTIVYAWSQSDVTRLYINEIGYWAGIHFTKSNMMPRFTGIASPGNPTAGSSGSLATGTYYIQITGTDSLNQKGESQNYQVSAGVAVTGPNGSLTMTMPSTSNYTYNVYIGTSSSPTNLATSNSISAGVPTVGVLTGQAVNLTPGSTVTLTGVGLFQVPPAPPQTGVTVYPTFVFGAEYFACTTLEDVSWTFLMTADKSDPLNQLRIIGYKFFQGYVILNQRFGCRIESSVSNTGTYG